MPRIILSVLFLLTLVSAVMAQDPVKVDATHYKVEFENSEVRVLRIKVAPHEKSIMHQHPNAVAIFLTDLNGKFTFPDGKTENVTSKTGEARWTPAITHQPENAGDKPFELILVELKSKPVAKRSAKMKRRAE